MSQVVLQHVEKTYPNGVLAVAGLDFSVAAGELFVLVGPSGCGKTTTLRLVAGLEQVSKGEIFLGDRPVNGVPPADRDVAMVLQTAALYPHMSIRENMAFGLKMRRTASGEIERRVKEAADALAIDSLLDRRPAELSGGQRRRVAIGRAIVRAPQVFLFDEPLSDLDPPLRAQLRAQIGKLHTRLGATIIYVTHDQAEAMTLGERIGVMERGAIRQIDTPENIYHRPASAFVASFIGSPGMNLIAGDVRSGVFRWRDASGNGKAAEGGIAVGTALGDGQVTLGVRPSDLSLGTSGHALASVRLDLVERLGHETLAHFELAGATHIARLPADAVARPREEVQLSVRSDRLHFFSASDGRRLN